MLQKRILFVMNIPESKIWTDLFTNGMFDEIWSVTNGMPREVIQRAVEIIDDGISAGNSALTEDNVQGGIAAFSADRLDDLASEFKNSYPRLSLLFKQFQGGPKEFDLDSVQEAAFKMAALAESQPDLSEEIVWATCGVDEPNALARALLRIRFLLLKTGRTAAPHEATEDEIQGLSGSNYFAIHPMYGAALELEGVG
jgi:hypothetical protein